MSELPHRIVLKLDGPDIWVARIECPYGTASRPCATFTTAEWPDEHTCLCTDLECPCREGHHDECEHYEGFVEEVGPECRSERLDECWYAHAVGAVGGEMLDFGRAQVMFTAYLSGHGFDEPIEAEIINASLAGAPEKENDRGGV